VLIGLDDRPVFAWISGHASQRGLGVEEKRSKKEDLPMPSEEVLSFAQLLLHYLAPQQLYTELRDDAPIYFDQQSRCLAGDEPRGSNEYSARCPL
jgi:hypothetical protein